MLRVSIMSFLKSYREHQVDIELQQQRRHAPLKCLARIGRFDPDPRKKTNDLKSSMFFFVIYSFVYLTVTNVPPCIQTMTGSSLPNVVEGSEAFPGN